ncbi:hypothetical protein C8R45DRAFT_930923 [Mycena sanguinolenta]|nr:hypothetical protein C8R45DRAFT_930923 [Mycena sanguinolenta]
MPTIQMLFKGVRCTAQSWNIPGNDHYSFAPLPANATALAVAETRSLFVNREYDGRLEELTLDEARSWGCDDQNEAGIVFAYTLSTTSRFCLRLVLNVDEVIRNKRSKKYRTLCRLVQDAKFHSTHLAAAAVVPIHYGMWLMETDDCAGKVLFSLTQWCGVSWHELSHTKLNTKANRVLVGRTLEALHDWVQWGNLRNPKDFRHVTIDIHAPGLSRDDLLSGNAPCYIVGFSDARANHRCMRKLPILPLGAYVPLKAVGCDEIGAALILLDFMDASYAPVPVSKALEWHAKYSDLHPDADNLDVIQAQRAKLYPNIPPLFPVGLAAAFESEDESSAIILQTSPLGSEMRPSGDSPIES